MKKRLFAISLMLAATNAMAGQACNDIQYMCPGAMCYAQQVSCQSERELEARIQKLKEAEEAEEAAAAEKKRNVEAANDERQKREQMNLKSENSSATPASPSVSAPARKAAVKTVRQKSTLPPNAKWNAPPMLGWSCLGGFHQEGMVCLKDQ